jgi:hypothetical protein
MSEPAGVAFPVALGVGLTVPGTRDGSAGGAFRVVELTALAALPEAAGLTALAGADGVIVTPGWLVAAASGDATGASGGSARSSGDEPEGACRAASGSTLVSAVRLESPMIPPTANAHARTAATAKALFGDTLWDRGRLGISRIAGRCAVSRSESV